MAKIKINKDPAAPRGIYKRVREELLKLFGDRLISIKVFGSYARGAVGTESDLDLFVVLDIPDDRTIDAAVKALVALDLPVPVDIVVRNPGQIEERLALGDPFFKRLNANGIEIYENVDPRVVK